MTHWARSLIGQPWTKEHNCRWFVREVCRLRWGIDLPVVVVDEPAEITAVAIKQIAQACGLRPLGFRQQLQPLDGDVVIMRSQVELHCGMVVAANGRIGVLHSHHTTGVVWDVWRDAVAGMTYEIWRRT